MLLHKAYGAECQCLRSYHQFGREFALYRKFLLRSLKNEKPAEANTIRPIQFSESEATRMHEEDPLLQLMVQSSYFDPNNLSIRREMRRDRSYDTEIARIVLSFIRMYWVSC